MRAPLPCRMKASACSSVVGMSRSVRRRSCLQLRRDVVAKTPTPCRNWCPRIARASSPTRLWCQMSSSSPKIAQNDLLPFLSVSRPQCFRKEASARYMAARRCWNWECRCCCSTANIEEPGIPPRGAVFAKTSSNVRRTKGRMSSVADQLTAKTKSIPKACTSCSRTDSSTLRKRCSRASVRRCADISPMITTSRPLGAASGVATSARGASGGLLGSTTSPGTTFTAMTLSTLSGPLNLMLIQPVPGPVPETSL
mmetsp:Transcript_48658/g.139045  ORF Transcript_48658/g.139045 Transcript_48658/m.139045 type:complete len:254 (+) Transcript_48658:1174-1935(+)